MHKNFPTLQKRGVYIEENSNEARADKLIHLFEVKAKKLAKSPKIGRLRPELMESLRSFAVGSYVLFYLPLVNGIEIVRVLHGARDAESVFSDEESNARDIRRPN